MEGIEATQSAGEARQALIDRLMVETKADGACFIRYARRDDALYYSPVEVTGDGRFLDTFDRLDGTNVITNVAEISTPRERDGVDWLAAKNGPMAARQYVLETVYRPCDITDQLRVLVFDGREMIGYLALVSRGGPEFRQSDYQTLKTSIPEIRSAIHAADALEHFRSDLPPGHLLTTADGCILYATPGASAWLNETRRAVIQRRVRGFDAGALPATHLFDGVELRVARLLGQSASRYVVNLAGLPRFKLAAARMLTTRQLQVAEYAAAGATAGEIATTLGSSPHTVRTQLRAIYRRLGVRSRVELAQVLDTCRPSLRRDD